MITLLTYISATGKCPFTAWLNKLDVQVRAKVRVRIDRVRFGNFGDCKQLKDAQGVWELRIDYGSGYRVYFGKKGNKLWSYLQEGIKEAKSVTLQRQSVTGKK